MKDIIKTAALIATALLLSTSASYANVDKMDVKGKAATGKPAVLAATGTTADQAKPASKIKLIDINSASRVELKTLPGIRDAEADKIIAGRPYGSKAFLVTRNIIPAATYEQIKRLIIARQQ